MSLLVNQKYRKIVLLGLAIGIVSAAVAVFELHSAYQLEISRAKVQSENYAQVLENQLSATLTKFDLIMSEVVRTIENKRGKSPLSKKEIQDILEERKGDIAEARSFFVVDRDGFDLFRMKDKKNAYFGDRDYFVLHQHSLENRMIISRPLTGRLTGVRSVIFSRKLLDKNGAFNGIVAVGVPLTFFKDIFQQMNLGKEGRILLQGSDNTLYAVHPWNESLIGAAALREQDHRQYIISSKKVAHTDFFISVVMSRDEILQFWKRRCLLYAFAFVVFWLGGLVSLIRFIKSIHELDERKKRAVENAKLISLGEMASGIAHEINNPLAVIHTRAMQLKRQIERNQFEPEKFTDSLMKINQTVDRIARIIRGLKSFARNADQDPFIPVAVKTIVDNALTLCGEKFRNHHVLLKVEPVPELMIEARESQLVQVLLNVLMNAFDAVCSQDDRWVSVSFSTRMPGSVAIEITDSGPGIPSEIAHYIMQPFFSTKDVGKGTGLGLSISKGIIDDHRGDFFLDRKSLHTKFVIVLPIRHQSNTPVDQAS